MSSSSRKYPDLKWLVQNGRTLIFRNLFSDRIKATGVASTRIEIITGNSQHEYSTVLKSGIITSSCNPSWTFSGLQSTDLLWESLESKAFVLRVYLVEKESESVLVEELFDLSRLVTFKIPANDRLNFPFNFIFFDVDEGSMTSERLYSRLYSREKIPPVKFFELDVDDDASSSPRESAPSSNPTVALTKTIADNRQKINELRKEVMETRGKTKKNTLEAIKAHKLLELERLRKDVEKRKTDLETEKVELATASAAETELTGIQEQLTRCKELIADTEASVSVVETKKKFLLKSQFLLETRQIKLLSELQAIYPIEPLDNGEHAIRGLELPVDLNSKDEELVASSLCYVVHLLILASKYLEVPLRYQILFLGSRSMIRDPVLGSSGTLPLFRRNVEKERFERAIIWLKRDIEQLLLVRGIYYDHGKDILQNVQQLFQCEICPKMAV